MCEPVFTNSLLLHSAQCDHHMCSSKHFRQACVTLLLFLAKSLLRCITNNLSRKKKVDEPRDKSETHPNFIKKDSHWKCQH